MITTAKQTTKRLLNFWKKTQVDFQDTRFCIFNHPMIYQTCDVMMSIST